MRLPCKYPFLIPSLNFVSEFLTNYTRIKNFLKKKKYFIYLYILHTYFYKHSRSNTYLQE